MKYDEDTRLGDSLASTGGTTYRWTYSHEGPNQSMATGETYRGPYCGYERANARPGGSWDLSLLPTSILSKSYWQFLLERGTRESLSIISSSTSGATCLATSRSGHVPVILCLAKCLRLLLGGFNHCQRGCLDYDRFTASI